MQQCSDAGEFVAAHAASGRRCDCHGWIQPVENIQMKRSQASRGKFYQSERRLACGEDIIDREGYRLSIGIVLCNGDRRVFWARRAGMRSWQFPQGGIKKDEEPEFAMFRELYEEVGLRSDDVEVIGRTESWLRYQLPERYVRRHSLPLCIGQKQIWYVLGLRAPDSAIRLDCSDRPEFDDWRWVDYWFPINDVVYFKREIYRQALTELGVYLLSAAGPRIDASGFLIHGRPAER
jgi:putative (di)nucleoside polyphosphate hydrolase